MSRCDQIVLQPNPAATPRVAKKGMDMKKHTLPIAITALALLVLTTMSYWPGTEAPRPTDDQTTSSPDTLGKAATGSTSDNAAPINRTAATATTQPSTGKDGSGTVRWLLTGVVTNSDGAPQDNVLVRATAETFYFGHTDLQPSTTDRAGRYVIDLDPWRNRSPLDRSQVTLLATVVAPTQTGRVSAKFPDGADSNRSLTLSANIDLETLATVTGRLVDVRGKPVANAEVQLRTHPASDDIMPPYDHTDEHGRYRLAVGMEGPHLVHAQRRDIGVATWQVNIVDDKHVDAPDLVLTAASELTGQAVYPDGQPVANARLMLAGSDYIETDASGRFEARHLAPGTHHISPPGQPKDGGDVTTGTGFQLITIRSARLRMQFRGPNNEVLTRQDVYAYWFPEAFGPVIENATTLNSIPANARSASVPHYEHGADIFAPHGSWFWIETPHGAQRPSLCVVQMAVGANETIAVMPFASPDLNAELHVTATREDGTQVQDLFVGLEQLTRGPRVPFAKLEGGAIGKAMRIPAGTYRLGVWQGWRSQYPETFQFEETIRVAPGETLTKNVKLIRGGLLDITVHRHGGTPGERVEASATVRIDGKEQSLAPYFARDPDQWSDRERDFLKIGQRAKSKMLLPVGTHTIRLRSGDEAWTTSVEIVAGERAHARFDLDH